MITNLLLYDVYHRQQYMHSNMVKWVIFLYFFSNNFELNTNMLKCVQMFKSKKQRCLKMYYMYWFDQQQSDSVFAFDWPHQL